MAITKNQNQAIKKRFDLAVIETGGKQYLVKKGDKIKIEKIQKPLKGSILNFEKVLLVTKEEEIKVGKPYVDGAKVKAQWLAEKRGKKITNVRYKSKTRRQRKQGHRQTYAEVIISDF